MSTLSDKAFAVMAVCPEAKKYYGITVDYLSKDSFKFVWAFKVDPQKAHREGYDSTNVNGAVELDDEYPGCPYCKSKRFYMCTCGMIVCWHGERVATCPRCGKTGELESCDSINLRGGGF